MLSKAWKRPEQTIMFGLRKPHPMAFSMNHNRGQPQNWYQPASDRQKHTAHVTHYSNPTFVFACGGTGGHITPALAVAEELKRTLPHCQVKFFGESSGPESELVPKNGFRLHHMPNTSFHRPYLDIRNFWRMFRLLVQVIQHVRELRLLKPAAVIGTGCYAAFPACLAAAICGTPLFLIEPNSIPGFANRLLAPLCTAIFISHLSACSTLPKQKVVLSGTPVLRRFGATDKAKAKTALHLGHQEYLLTVVGGSSGSDQLSNAMLAIIPRLLDAFPTLHIHHQHTSDLTIQPEYKAAASRRYRQTTFFHNMAEQLAASDLVLSRSGALTCAEMLHTGVPSVLWPLASSTDGHQQKNADAMVSLGTSVLFEEAGGPDAGCSTKLYECLLHLLSCPERLSKMKSCTSACMRDATTVIVQYMVQSMDTKTHPN